MTWAAWLCCVCKQSRRHRGATCGINVSVNTCGRHDDALIHYCWPAIGALLTPPLHRASHWPREMPICSTTSRPPRAYFADSHLDVSIPGLLLAGTTNIAQSNLLVHAQTYQSHVEQICWHRGSNQGEKDPPVTLSQPLCHQPRGSMKLPTYTNHVPYQKPQCCIPAPLKKLAPAVPNQFRDPYCAIITSD